MQSLASSPLIVKIVLECSIFGSTIIALVVCSLPTFPHLSHEKKTQQSSFHRAFSNQKSWTVAEWHKVCKYNSFSPVLQQYNNFKSTTEKVPRQPRRSQVEHFLLSKPSFSGDYANLKNDVAAWTAGLISLVETMVVLIGSAIERWCALLRSEAHQNLRQNFTKHWSYFTTYFKSFPPSSSMAIIRFTFTVCYWGHTNMN